MIPLPSVVQPIAEERDMNRFNLLHGPSISLMAVLLAVSLDTSAQEPDLTYQGQLRQAGEAFTGTANLEFRLFDQLASGSQIGPPLSYPNWPINGGLFQVELDFGSSAFEGGDRYLEILVNDAPLQPRQWVTATPYALFAAGVAAGSIGSVEIDSSQVQQRITGGCPAGQSIRAIDQSGGVTCEADDLGPVGWNLNGNAGTNPATDFIGTTDAIPFEIRAADARSLRIEPSSDLSQGLPVTVNIIAGSRANLVSAGVRGATIGGGGLPENSTVDFPNGAPNQVTQDFGTIGGGFANQAGIFATVGGGRVNSASGRSFIGGGESNSAINESVVGGGTNNEASGIASVVAGGTGNEASGLQSAVGGGGGNTASGSRATVAGGVQNEAIGSESSAGGGFRNAARGTQSTISGGFDNEADGDQSVVAGGQVNRADGNWSAVSGGQSNCAGGDHSWASGRRAKVRASGDGTGCGFSTPGSGDADGDEGTFIWADSQSQDFVSNGPNQFLVRAQGGVGFGGTPADYFDIRTPVVFTPGDGVPEDGAFRVRLDGATKFRVFANGGVGVGSSFSGPGVPENGLRVQGRVQLASLGFGGNTDLCRNSDDEVAICSSSSRYKDEIGVLDLGLDAVLALAPVSYRWTSDDSRDIGFVAEDIAEIDGRLITRNPEGEIEGVRYSRLTAVLANAVQDMARQQQQYNSGIDAISAENVRLRERLVQLESDGADAQRALTAKNEQLRARLAALEAQHATELESLSMQLSLLRDVVMPRTVQVEAEEQGRSSVQESLQ